MFVLANGLRFAPPELRANARRAWLRLDPAEAQRRRRPGLRVSALKPAVPYSWPSRKMRCPRKTHSRKLGTSILFRHLAAAGKQPWSKFPQRVLHMLRRKVSVPQHRPRRSPSLSASQRRRPASPPWTFSRIECRTFHRGFARKSGYLLYEHAGAGVAPACRTCSGGGGSPMHGTGLQRASGPSCCWPKCCDSVAPYHLSLSG